MTTLNEFNQQVGELIPNWKPCDLPIKKNLAGHYCVLEPIDIEKHASTLFDVFLIDNEGGASWTYLPYGPFETCELFIDWLKEVISDPDTFLYAIINQSTQKTVGIAGYLRMNPQHGVIEVGHVHFSALMKRSPVATEAIYLLTKYVFDELCYRRYEWKCNSYNIPSRNAALRYGFQFEGTFRQSNVFKNHNRDTDWFSMLDCEWPTIKMKFERWLDPSNFDGAGNQKKTLNDFTQIR